MLPTDKGRKEVIRRFLGRKNLACGAGGSRAILAGAGVIVACEVAGVDEWDTIGGISGGFFPGYLKACGYTGAQILKEAVNIDFSSLVPRHATPLHTFVAFLLKDRFEYTRPKRGVLGSEPIGEFARRILNESPAMKAAMAKGETLNWPHPGFWTMGVVARTQILYTAKGVYQYLRNGEFRVLSTEPAPIEIAARSTVAVPGIIDAAPYKASPTEPTRYVFDGALSWDGQCPVGVTIRHFKAQPEDIIGCDVGDEQHKWSTTFRWFWSLLCGGHCVDSDGPKTEIPDSVLMVRPNVWSVRSLQFDLPVEQKWQAVMSGFQEGVIELNRAGLLTGDRLKLAFSIAMDVEKLKALVK